MKPITSESTMLETVARAQHLQATLSDALAAWCEREDVSGSELVVSLSYNTALCQLCNERSVDEVRELFERTLAVAVIEVKNRALAQAVAADPAAHVGQPGSA